MPGADDELLADRLDLIEEMLLSHVDRLHGLLNDGDGPPIEPFIQARIQAFFDVPHSAGDHPNPPEGFVAASQDAWYGATPEVVYDYVITCEALRWVRRQKGDR